MKLRKKSFGAQCWARRSLPPNAKVFGTADAFSRTRRMGQDPPGFDGLRRPAVPIVLFREQTGGEGKRGGERGRDW